MHSSRRMHQIHVSVYNFRPDDVKNAKKYHQIISYYGKNMWNWGMDRAAFGGHQDLVNFFIQKGANNWDLGMEAAAEGGHKHLVVHFVQKVLIYGMMDCIMQL